MSRWNYVLIFLVYYLLLRWKLVDTNPHTFGVESSYCQMRFRQAFGLGERDAYLDPKLKYLSRELLVCFLLRCFLCNECYQDLYLLARPLSRPKLELGPCWFRSFSVTHWKQVGTPVEHLWPSRVILSMLSNLLFFFPNPPWPSAKNRNEPHTLSMDLLQRVVSSTITTDRSDVDETKSSTAGAQKICSWSRKAYSSGRWVSSPFIHHS